MGARVFSESAPPQDPTVGLYLGPYESHRGMACSYERGTPVNLEILGTGNGSGAAGVFGVGPGLFIHGVAPAGPGSSPQSGIKSPFPGL